MNGIDGITERMVGAPKGSAFNSSVDHFSRFLGLAVSNLYLLAAFCTLWEVFARYFFHSPTQWVFEVVMVLCASAWMLSAGFVTLQKRHIGITVFYLMATERTRWWLDLFAMVVGVFALYMLVSDTLIRALESIDLVERGGTAWNSPLPMVLKTVLVTGLFVYLVQLLVNLSRHFRSNFLQFTVYATLALICVRLLVSMFGHYDVADGMMLGIDESIAGASSNFVDQFRVDREEIGIGTISLVIVMALLALMMTGMPLGIVTLIISVICALVFYGNTGMYLVSTNAMDLLEKYPLVGSAVLCLDGINLGACRYCSGFVRCDVYLCGWITRRRCCSNNSCCGYSRGDVRRHGWRDRYARSCCAATNVATGI